MASNPLQIDQLKRRLPFAGAKAISSQDGASSGAPVNGAVSAAASNGVNGRQRVETVSKEEVSALGPTECNATDPAPKQMYARLGAEGHHDDRQQYTGPCWELHIAQGETLIKHSSACHQVATLADCCCTSVITLAGCTTPKSLTTDMLSLAQLYCSWRPPASCMYAAGRRTTRA